MLHDAQLEGKVKDREEALEYLRLFLKKG